MGRYKARCDNCKGAETFSETLCSYKFDDGADLTIEQTFAWCSQCSKVVWAESIPSIEQVISRTKSDLDRRVQWRESRQSPPRCLSCGSTEITSAEKGFTHSGNPKWEIPCPSCDGVIRVLVQPCLSLNRGWIHYTPEGLHMGSYEMSPSKGAVPSDRKP